MPTDRIKEVRVALRNAAVRHGIDPDILDVIGWVESRWHREAKNLAGSDGARGGAWGPTQITEQTARAHGYEGSVSLFCEDVELAAKWTALIMCARPGGPPKRLEDACAWWNAGRASFDRLGPVHPTRVSYYPQAVKGWERVKKEPV